MKTFHALMMATVLLGGCKKGNADPKIDELHTVLSAFIKPGADAAALSNALRPQAADYDAVYVGEAAAKARTGTEPHWDNHEIVLNPPAEDKDIIIVAAPQPELAKGNTHGCPNNYLALAPKFQPGVVIYCARFEKPGSKPGDKQGGDVNALVFVNGHWALFPKPWRALMDRPTGAKPGGTTPAPAPTP